MQANNQYMEQVIAEQAAVEKKLKSRPRRSAVAHGGEMHDTDASAVDVRITGFWRWKNVIVAPNAYVVHTRRGRSEPLHCGMGTSFRFNPLTDSYLVVPAAMQTVIINANCICKEKQGILVQGYVQWTIDDFQTAYQKLDLSDPVDPMRVVNTQLREQAEAVIKDTVATMTLEGVLSDRQPIIQELTERLRRIMEGDAVEQGLGLRIVTVQIKEAVVSSATLWETLQRPFRAERAKEARLGELAHHEVTRNREAQDQETAAVLEIATEAAIAKRQAAAEATAFDREQEEITRRAKIEAARLQESIEFEKEKANKRAELARLILENELADARLRFDAENEQSLAEIATDASRRKVANDLSPELLKQKLIEAMPEIAENMPTPTEMKSVSINGVDGLSGLMPALLALVDRVGGGRPNGVANE